ncbi:MAG: FG-GAP repeat domain-containing protein, partial [Gemmatimonadota bacterium]
MSRPRARVRARVGGRTWLALGLLAWVGCGRGGAPGAWHEEGSYRWRELRVRGHGEGFTSLPARRTGITFTNSLSDAAIMQNQNLLAGSGVALGDVDGDGRVDIYLARLEGPNVLYRNLGGWRFEDVTERAGVAAAGRYSTGAVLGDVDGDGDLDLLVSALGGPNALYENDGTGVFREVTAQAGLESRRGSMTMALADVDGDGDLDLYVANYKVLSALDKYAPEERTFDKVVRKVGGKWEVVPEFRADYRVEVLEALGKVVRIQRAEPDFFYLNDGRGQFERQSWTGGRWRDEGGRPLSRVPDYFGFTARFYDMNGDGAPDLYVCDDFEDPDQIWLNDGRGGFRAAPWEAVRTTSNAGMAVDFADIDRDGDVDFFEIDMRSRDPVRWRMQRPSHTALPKLPGVMEDRPQMQRNTLQVNRGDGTWAQLAEYAGVEGSEWSWGTMFLDVDLDGYEDLLIANGHAWDVQNLDSQLRLRSLRRELPWPEESRFYGPLEVRNLAFRNVGGERFEEVGRQ